MMLITLCYMHCSIESMKILTGVVQKRKLILEDLSFYE